MTRNSREFDIRISEPEELVCIDIEDLEETFDLSALGSKDFERLEAAVVEVSNAMRAQNGLPPLTPNDRLAQAAVGHSFDMAEGHFMSHTGSDGSTLSERVARAGYRQWTRIGENVAMGYLTAESVVAGWMNSPGHRKNLLSPEFTEIGVGYVAGPAQATDGSYRRAGYWTQDFGARMASVEPADLVRRAWRAAVQPRQRDIEHG